MNSINLLITVLYLLFFSFPIESKELSTFHPAERKIIRDFLDLAYGLTKTTNAIEQAKAYINSVQNKIDNKELDPDFKLSDLFTTYYDDKEHQLPFQKSFLSEYCRTFEYNSDFYTYILEYLKENPDFYNYQRWDGMTPLMQIANYFSPNSNPTSCAESLIKKGSNPLKAFGRGNLELHSALTLALIGHNVPIIELFLKELKDKSPNRDWKNQELLKAYNGEVFEPYAIVGQHVFDLYRVANQALNIPMVEKMQEQYRYLIGAEFKRSIDLWENDPEVKNERGTFYYPPLWAYNALELKKYALKILQEIESQIIDKNNLKLIDKQMQLYEYENNGKKITLMKKDTKPLLGRVLGRNHLAKSLEESNSKHLAVAQKFLVYPHGPLAKAKVIFTFAMNYSYESSKGILQGISGTNPVNVEIEGIELYAEYIEGSPTQAPRFAGFIDNDKGNAIRSKKDKKIYIIDTGDDKNFLVRVGDAFKAFQAKVFNFAPHIRQIVLDLGK
jgi:ankyrin repeat protein